MNKISKYIIILLFKYKLGQLLFEPIYAVMLNYYTILNTNRQDFTYGFQCNTNK